MHNPYPAVDDECGLTMSLFFFFFYGIFIFVILLCPFLLLVLLGLSRVQPQRRGEGAYTVTVFDLFARCHQGGGRVTVMKHSHLEREGGSSTGSKYLSAPHSMSCFVGMALRCNSPHKELSQMTPQLPCSSAKRPREDDAKASGEIVVDDNERNTIETVAYLMQNGSPVYDPVKQLWCCWEGHEMHPRKLEEYALAEGVTCDFCGESHWRQSDVDCQSNSLTNMRTITGGNREGEALFYHCESCGMDLCFFCARDVYEDERYHVPCVQCKRCGVFLKTSEGLLHRCDRRACEQQSLPSGATKSVGDGTSSSLSDISSHIGLKRESSADKLYSCCGWELRVAHATPDEVFKIRDIASSLLVEGTETTGDVGCLVFHLPTRLISEEFAQRAKDMDLFTSIQKLGL
uniref:Uncharacterized protein TCIL3000_4_620 n=1 Tax=Trypanosoma congolense (strain IL3000) TaxID=1068625 RepID=G0UKS3_TRYCI|nr:unnamed protein product [Trypanosoma congolense IL3000]